MFGYRQVAGMTLEFGLYGDRLGHRIENRIESQLVHVMPFFFWVVTGTDCAGDCTKLEALRFEKHSEEMRYALAASGTVWDS